jgi:sporulation protein YlmC with PRC-barrel domain
VKADPSSDRRSTMKATISILAVMTALVFALSYGALADPGQKMGEEPKQSSPKPEISQKGQPQATEQGRAPGMTGTERPMKPDAAQVQEDKKTKETPEVKAAERINEPLASSHIKDAKVKNEKGEDLGTVSDLILDPSGRVDFVIVSVGKGLFGDGKKIAVPYRAFKFIPQKGDEKMIFVLNLDKEKFGRAPDYRDDPRIFTDEERTAKIQRFYGLQPASQEGSVTPNEKSEQMGERQGKPSAYGKGTEEGSQEPMGTTREMAPEGQKR